MTQLDSFLFDSFCLADIRRLQSYSPTTRPTVTRLIETTSIISKCSLLVVSGRTVTHDTYIFGAFVA